MTHLFRFLYRKFNLLISAKDLRIGCQYRSLREIVVKCQAESCPSVAASNFWDLCCLWRTDDEDEQLPTLRPHRQLSGRVLGLEFLTRDPPSCLTIVALFDRGINYRESVAPVSGLLYYSRRLAWWEQPHVRSKIPPLLPSIQVVNFLGINNLHRWLLASGETQAKTIFKSVPSLITPLWND